MPLQEIAAQDIHQQARANAARSWPRRDTGNRLSPDCRPAITPKFTFQGGETFFAIGSCFARNIEEAMARNSIAAASRDIAFPDSELLPGARSNSLLIKYTPGSICEEVAQALEPGYARDAEAYLLERDPGQFCDLNLSQVSPTVGLARGVERRRQVQALFAKLADCDAVFITLGLIEEWFDRTLGIHINSMPEPQVFRRHPRRFVCRQSSYDEVLAQVSRTIGLIHAANANARIILTTSPVPLKRTFFGRDVIVENMLSKSMLCTAAQSLAACHKLVDYFPSYEMVMLSEAETTWQADGRHVSEDRVDDVMRHFLSAYFPGRPQQRTIHDLAAAARQASAAGNAAAALEAYAEIRALGGLDERTTAAFVTAARDAGETDTAESLCREALAKGMKVKQFSALLLDTLFASGDAGALRSETAVAMQDAERVFGAHVAAARLAEREGQMQEARAQTQAARALHDQAGFRNPEPVWLREQLAYLLIRFGS